MRSVPSLPGVSLSFAALCSFRSFMAFRCFDDCIGGAIAEEGAYAEGLKWSLFV